MKFRNLKRQGKFLKFVGFAQEPPPPPPPPDDDPPPPPPPDDDPPPPPTGTVTVELYHLGNPVSSITGYYNATFYPTTGFNGADITLGFSVFSEDFTQSFYKEVPAETGFFSADAEFGAEAETPVVLFGVNVFVATNPVVDIVLRFDLTL